MKKTYSVSEAAKLLGYSSNSVYSYLKNGEIKSSRLGKGKFRIPQTEIDRLLAKEPMAEVENKIENVVEEKPAIMPTPVCLVPPKPGSSLSDIGSEKPFRTIVLWLQERVGLPKLFDWFVALSSVVLGISMFLYTKQFDSILIGRYAVWFTPLIVALLSGGVGLILADMLQDEAPIYKHFNNIFRYILVATYTGLAFLQLSTNDVDGFLINGLFALVILIEAMFGVLSSTAYMIYIQGLLLGMALIFRYYPYDSGLSALSVVVYGVIDGASWILSLVIMMFIGALLYGYFWNKLVLKIILGVSGLMLVAMSVYYADTGYYARSFFVLIAGIVGMILPFWEQFKRRCEEDRTIVFRMFGTILMAFALAVLIIGSVQTILTTNGMRNLLEKANFAKITLESTVADTESILEGITQNTVFISAMKAGRTNDLESFLKAVFKNNRSFNSVVIADLAGRVTAVYPFSEELQKFNLSKENFYVETIVGERPYVSKVIESFSPQINKTIIISIPILDPQTKKILGAAIVNLSAEYLSETMQLIAEGGAEQVISVVDNEGRWMVNPENQAIGELVTEADASYDLWKKSIGQGRGYDRRGRYSLFASEKSEILGWSAVVSQPMAKALDVSRSGLILVLFLLMVAALTVVFSYVFSKNKLVVKGV